MPPRLALTLGALCLALAAARAAPEERDAHAVLLPDGSLSLLKGRPHAAEARPVCASAHLVDGVAADGWARLAVNTSAAGGACSDAQQAYAAGLVEAKVSYVGMFQTVVNGALNASLPDSIVRFFADNARWTAARVAESAAEAEAEAGHGAVPGSGGNVTLRAYWHQVGLAVRQMEGLVDGYRLAAPAPYQVGISDLSLQLLTTGNDLETLQGFMLPEDWVGPRVGFGRGGHCSALARLTDDLSELYVAHDTWSSLNSMLRTYKRYDFDFTADGAGAAGAVPAVTFSSYPGALFSGDDFYQIESGLTVLETTIGNNNASLWANVRPESVLVWQRNVVANRLAAGGAEWCATFAYLQSGTYNNEYFVADYNRFTPGHHPEAGALYVLDQLPGLVHYADMTDRLVRDGYLPSYNSPVFPSIFEAGGFQEQVDKFGAWFSYNGTARANIFRRDAPNVTTEDDMKSIMRYNDFKHDPFARCDCTPPYSAENGVACRDDLNPANGTYAFGALGQRNHAATDSKISSHALMAGLRTLAISSPTYEQQPVFQFSTSPYAHVPHLGMPDRWEFPWVTIQW